MQKKIIVFMLLFSVLSAVVSGVEIKEKETIYVDDDNTSGPWDGSIDHPYQYIQDAIESAQIDDTVFVKNGTYYENIFINKTITLLGEDKQSTIIDGQNQSDVIYVGYPANGVSISGFSIQNAGGDHGNNVFDAGIDLQSDHNIISDNILTKHHIACIILFGSSHNIIEHNYIGDCSCSGIEFLSGRFNYIANNTVINNLKYGIFVSEFGNSSGNLFFSNIFEKNRQGITLFHSNNTIAHNNFLNNYVRHASSRFNIWIFSPSHNSWKSNYYDDCKQGSPKFIPGLFGFNFDWYPANDPYEITDAGGRI